MINCPDDITKDVKCRCGSVNKVPFQTTIYKCPACGNTSAVMFFGTVIDKHGDYLYQSKTNE